MNFKESYTDTAGTVALACREGNIKLLRKFIAKGQPVDVKDNRGWFAIHEAAHQGAVECLGVLLKHKSVDVNIMTFESETPLLLAAMAGHGICIEALLKAGADPYKGTHESYTPLWAACKCSLDCVKLLVNGGADVNCQTAMKETGLHVAAHYGKAEIVAYLIEKGANIEITDENGLTPLFVAANFGQSDCLILLLEKAKSKGDLFLKKYIHHTADDGCPPLYIAAQEGSVDCVQALLDHGANPNMPLLTDLCGDGKVLPVYPFQVAIVMFRNEECARVLGCASDLSVYEWEKYSKNINIPSQYEYNPVMWVNNPIFFEYHPVVAALWTHKVQPMQILIDLKHPKMFQGIPPELWKKTEFEPAAIMAINGMSSCVLRMKYLSQACGDTSDDLKFIVLLCRLVKMNLENGCFYSDGNPWRWEWSIPDFKQQDRLASKLCALTKYKQLSLFYPDLCDLQQLNLCSEEIALKDNLKRMKHITTYKQPMNVNRIAGLTEEFFNETFGSLHCPNVMTLDHYARKTVILTMIRSGKYTPSGIQQLDIPEHMKVYMTVPGLISAFEAVSVAETEVDKFLELEDKHGVIPRQSAGLH